MSTLESIELRSITPLPANLSLWLHAFYESVPDKAIKKSVALLLKEMLIQITNFRG
jgi:hypothetical protein